MQLFLKTSPAQEPVTVEEVRIHLRLSREEDDDFLRSLIGAARCYVECTTGRALIKQKWGMHIKPPYPKVSPLVKCGGENLEVELPYPPLLEVESVKIDGKDLSFKVEGNKVIPVPFSRNKEISISYWAGYGETSSSLPPDLKHAVLIATRFFYDHQTPHLPTLRPYKVLHLI